MKDRGAGIVFQQEVAEFLIGRCVSPSVTTITMQGRFIVGCGVCSVVITLRVMTTLPNIEASTTLSQAHTLNCPVIQRIQP